MGFLYNAGSRARHTSSITNQNQGGGSKKAGLAILPLSQSARIAYNERGMPQTLAVMQMVGATVCQSRPVGWRMRKMCF